MPEQKPSPLVMAQFRHIAAEIDPAAPAKMPDNIVKAKHLRPGMVVRPYLLGAARGAQRTVATVQRSDDRTIVDVTFVDYPATTYLPAYRFIVLEESQ